MIFTIIHEIEGRVRIKSNSISKKIEKNQIYSQIKSIPFVKQVRINQTISSSTIEFQKDKRDLVMQSLQKLELKNEKLALMPTDRANPDNVLKAIISLIGSKALPTSISMPLTYYTNTPVLLEGVDEFLKKGFTSHVLESMAVLASLIGRDYSAANTTSLLIQIAEYIEESIVNESNNLLKQLVKPNIDEVWIEKENQEIKIDTKELKIGDIVIVNAGDTIPIDGSILTGEALIDEASMSGESIPIKKSRGDRAISGTVISEGRIKIYAENIGENTATARIADYIKNSLDSKSQTQLKANHLAEKLVPVTLILSSIAYLSSKDFKRVSAVLQADYSCALRLATPVAFKSSMYKSGLDGIMIKGADVLEKLAEVDTFVFDKTGTLTTGDLEVTDIISLNRNWNEDKILSLAASIEEHYFHPVAEAIVKSAKEKNFEHMNHDDVDFIVAHGVATEVENRQVLIGSRHFLEDDEKVKFSKETDKKIQGLSRAGKAIIYIAYDKKLLGLIALKDEVREETESTLTKLRELGAKKIVILTGDNEIKANELKKELNIDLVYANLLPEDKANIVKELSKDSKIAFIGDGINDAPALISSHVGISMHKGADIAKMASSVALLDNNLALVAKVKEVANKTIKLIDTNFKTTVTLNSIILALATVGKLSPINTAFLHNGTTIFTLLKAIKGIKLD